MVYHLARLSEPPSGRDVRISALAAAALACAAFAPAVTFGFVYDDRWTVSGNRWLDAPLRELMTAVAAGVAPLRGIPDATRPSMIVSLWIDRRLFGQSPLGHHLHSLVLYALASASAGLAAGSLLRNRAAAVIAAVFFAAAPVHAEVVAAINYREDLIAGLGILVPLAWLFRRSERKDSPNESLLVAACFGWGLLGKESAAALLLLIPFSALVLRVNRPWLEARERTLYFLGSAFVLWANWRLALTIGDDGIPRAPAAPLGVLFVDTARFVVKSVLGALATVNPSPEYSPAGHAGPYWLLGATAVATAVLLLARSKSGRPLALGLGIAAIAPLGSCPILRPVNPWADRYLFVSVLGGGMVLGALLAPLSARLGAKRAVMTLSLAATIAVVACWNAALIWRTERALWTYAVERAPRSPRAWAALSRVERLDGNLDRADELVARALAINSDDVPARVTRIYNLLARGSVEAARREIAHVDWLRGGAHPGMARARSCARGSPDDARRCIRAN